MGWHRMFGLGVFAVVMGTAAGPAGTALAQEPVGDVLAGRQFALEVCSECHFVAPEQIVEPYSEAPWFQDIADKPSTTELSLRVFLQSPHFSMPNFMLTPQETDDVISYILSLRKN